MIAVEALVELMYSTTGHSVAMYTARALQVRKASVATVPCCCTSMRRDIAGKRRLSLDDR